MLRKWLGVILLSMLLVIMLAACGGGEDEGASNEGADTEAETTEPAETEDADDSADVELAQGVSDTEIKIGHLGPQTGPAAIYDLARKGIQSYMNYVNENGGVNGREINLIAYDDQYQPSQAVQLAQKLVEEDKVFAMVGNVSTSNIAAYKDYLIEQGVPLTMMAVGAMDFFEPPIEKFVGSAIMNYQLEALVYLDYAVNELGAEKIAIAYQDDDFGKDGHTAVTGKIADYAGAEIVEEVTFLASDTEFSSQAQKISSADPDTVFYFGSPNPAANLKKAMHKIGLTDVNFIASSVAANDKNLFALAGPEVWEGTYSSAVFLGADLVEDDEQVAAFVEQFSSDYPDDPASGFAQYGWAAAQVLVEAIERSGDELTWDNLIDSFYSFDGWDGSLYSGITLSPDNHYAITSMFMTQAKDGEIEPITDTISVDPKTGDITYE